MIDLFPILKNTAAEFVYVCDYYLIFFLNFG